MPARIFTIPFDPAQGGFADEAFSQALLRWRVTSMKAEFFIHQERPYWTVLVNYEVPLERADTGDRAPEAALDEPQRLLLQRLREWRKEAAGSDGVPVFLIATNRQLAELAKAMPRSLEALRQVRGFGGRKVERYSRPIVEIVAAFRGKGSSAAAELHGPSEPAAAPPEDAPVGGEAGPAPAP